VLCAATHEELHMPDIHQAAQDVNTALDKIIQAGSDPHAIQQAVQEAKQKVNLLVQQAQQSGQQSQSQR
jgi:hypothetical protein